MGKKTPIVVFLAVNNAASSGELLAGPPRYLLVLDERCRTQSGNPDF